MNIIEAKKVSNSQPLAIVLSEFNTDITSKLLEGALARLEACNYDLKEITLVKVPGAIEIPLVVKRLAQSGAHQAIICLGAVIQGETRHFDYVCDQVSQGCQQVMLEFDIPVIFGVLTTRTEAEALDRVGGEHGHKGRDAVDTALAMLSVFQQLTQLKLK